MEENLRTLLFYVSLLSLLGFGAILSDRLKKSCSIKNIMLCMALFLAVSGSSVFLALLATRMI